MRKPDPYAIAVDPDRLDDIRPRCKALYFSGYSEAQIKKILELTELEETHLKKWIYGPKGTGNAKTCWEYEHKMGGDLVCKAFIQTKSAALENTGGVALSGLSMGIKRFVDKMSSDRISFQRQKSLRI